MDLIEPRKSGETVAVARTSDGRELLLHRHGDVFQIRVDGLELMSSCIHGTEDALARLACRDLAPEAPGPRVLIGGLGMGYTLRAALDVLPERAEVTVAEVFEAVAEWNRGPLAPLAGRPLEDPRTRLELRDVADFLDGAEVFDAILLDVDNGPSAFTLSSNDVLYSPAGLRRLRGIVRPGGVLAVWSGFEDAEFERRLEDSGFRVRTENVPIVDSDDCRMFHTIFLAYR